MSLSLSSDRVLANALTRALTSLSDQRRQLSELRALSRLASRGSTRRDAEPDEAMTAACMEALYAETLDFSVAGLTEVIEDLSRALEPPAQVERDEAAASRVHLRMVKI